MSDEVITAVVVAEPESIALPTDVRATKTSLIIPENTTFEKWQGIGKQLRMMEGAIQFWVGDWINFGERRFGEKYLEAIEATGYNYQTLREISQVSNRTCIDVDTSDTIQRHENLPFSHHREVI
jgi:hypothetical protein